ncbi:MAG: hypothetical protein LBI60_06435, partial [Bacteroidales bacterium]|nr:hypothetical protein [Bacteroidales bacterium]
MKRIFILALGLFMAMTALSQPAVYTWTEDFDGAVSFSAIPASQWGVNTIYYASASSTANPKSYLGLVPNNFGDSTILLTPPYDCSTYAYVVLS